MPTGLNDNHKRALVATLAHIDGLPTQAAHAATSAPSPFVEVDVLSDSLRAARAELMAAARALELPVPSPHINATSSIQLTLTFAGIALEDVTPKRLQGYGDLDAEAAALVERVEGDLARTFRRISVYLARREAGGLASRLERLERAPFDLQLLRLLQEIVTRRGPTGSSSRTQCVRGAASWLAGRHTRLKRLESSSCAQADPMRAQVRSGGRVVPVEEAEGIATDLAAIRQRCSA